jgi:metallo-beta-lactamase class B
MITNPPDTIVSHGCPCCNGGQPAVTAAAMENKQVALHLEAAKAAAGSDLTAYLKLADATHPNANAPTIEEMMKWPAPDPGKAFDNLYFVGSRWVSAWALVTDAGIILIDTMDNDQEAEQLIEGGMRKLGLDPGDIRIILVTHGHGDHYGGVNYLTSKYPARVLMSGIDWDTVVAGELEFDFPNWGRPPKRGESVSDGDVVSLGSTDVKILLTPGHTRGTISLLFEVRDKGQTCQALLWGGTAFNFGNRSDRIERLNQYIDSTGRAKAIVRDREVQVFISNHSLFDEAVEKLESLPHQTTNPFVTSVSDVERALTVMEECARATLIYWKDS